jgi:5-deoxy-D-glucuronate isomerase
MTFIFYRSARILGLYRRKKMRQYNSQNLVMHPGNSNDANVVVEVKPEAAGWDTINFQVRRLASCKSWSFETGEHELALVVLSGSLDVESNWGRFDSMSAVARTFSRACPMPSTCLAIRVSRSRDDRLLSLLLPGA